jgi:hypothetical protein
MHESELIRLFRRQRMLGFAASDMRPAEGAARARSCSLAEIVRRAPGRLTLDLDSVNEILTLGWISPPHTLFREVRSSRRARAFASVKAR